jgi:hypothetical protein
MVTFCPNIFVLVYLNRTRQLSQTLLRKGIENIQRAYRRQIQFRRWHPKGSFSSFGDRDSHGNTWLVFLQFVVYLIENRLSDFVHA